VFEHIDMLSISIQHQPYTVLLTLLGSDVGVLGHLWSQNDVIMSRLRLTATSKCFPHPYKTYTKKEFEHIDIRDVAVAVIALVSLLLLRSRLHCC
jgi:hypothetical protein